MRRKDAVSEGLRRGPSDAATLSSVLCALLFLSGLSMLLGEIGRQGVVTSAALALMGTGLAAGSFIGGLTSRFLDHRARLVATAMSMLMAGTTVFLIGGGDACTDVERILARILPFVARGAAMTMLADILLRSAHGNAAAASLPFYAAALGAGAGCLSGMMASLVPISAPTLVAGALGCDGMVAATALGWALLPSSITAVAEQGMVGSAQSNDDAVSLSSNRLLLLAASAGYVAAAHLLLCAHLQSLAVGDNKLASAVLLCAFSVGIGGGARLFGDFHAADGIAPATGRVMRHLIALAGVGICYLPLLDVFAGFRSAALAMSPIAVFVAGRAWGMVPPLLVVLGPRRRKDLHAICTTSIVGALIAVIAIGFFITWFGVVVTVDIVIASGVAATLLLCWSVPEERRGRRWRYGAAAVLIGMCLLLLPILCGTIAERLLSARSF